jgi:hypothetical protein
MRAAASRDWVLTRSWQSQRVTRRSLGVLGPFDRESVDRAGDGAVFQPVPSHSGQTSAETFINPGTLFNKISSFDFAPESGLGASANQRAIVHILCRSRAHCGGQRKNGGRKTENARARVRGRTLPNIASRLAKRPDPCQKWLRQRQFATPPVRNRLPARIFTVDIPSRGRRILPSGFPNSASPFVPVLRWERK